MVLNTVLGVALVRKATDQIITIFSKSLGKNEINKFVVTN
jgi:hypothetical protein